MANEHGREELAREPGMVGVWNRALDALARKLRVSAVPTPVRDLSELLARSDSVGRGIADLQRMEKALTRNDKLDSLPPDVLRAAAVQLDRLTDVNRSKGLAMLRLQIRRQVSSDLALEQAARSGQAMRWLPTNERTLGAAGEWNSAFVTTVPAERDDEAVNDSPFDERDKPVDFNPEERP